MPLFPEIDRTKTIQDVAYFFKHEYRRLLAMANMQRLDYKSPVVSDMPGGGPGMDAHEVIAMGIDVQNTLESLRRTINALPDREKSVFIKHIDQQMTFTDIAKSGIYAESTLKDHMSQAYLYIADGFHPRLSDGTIVDFHHYPTVQISYEPGTIEEVHNMAQEDR